MNFIDWQRELRLGPREGSVLWVESTVGGCKVHGPLSKGCVLFTIWLKNAQDIGEIQVKAYSERNSNE